MSYHNDMFHMVRKYEAPTAEFQSGRWLPTNKNLRFRLTALDGARRYRLEVVLHHTSIVTYILDVSAERIERYILSWNGWFTPTTSRQMHRAIDLWRTTSYARAVTQRLPKNLRVANTSPWYVEPKLTTSMRTTPSGTPIRDDRVLRPVVRVAHVQLGTYAGALRGSYLLGAHDTIEVDCTANTITHYTPYTACPLYHIKPLATHVWAKVEAEVDAYIHSVMGPRAAMADISAYLTAERRRIPFGMNAEELQQRRTAEGALDLLARYTSGSLSLDQYAALAELAYDSPPGEPTYRVRLVRPRPITQAAELRSYEQLEQLANE